MDIRKFKIVAYALLTLNAVLMLCYKLTATHSLKAFDGMQNLNPLDDGMLWGSSRSYVELLDHANLTLNYIPVWYALLIILIGIIALDYFVFRKKLYFVFVSLFFSFYWFIFVIYQMSSPFWRF